MFDLRLAIIPLVSSGGHPFGARHTEHQAVLAQCLNRGRGFAHDPRAAQRENNSRRAKQNVSGYSG